MAWPGAQSGSDNDIVGLLGEEERRVGVILSFDVAAVAKFASAECYSKF